MQLLRGALCSIPGYIASAMAPLLIFAATYLLIAVQQVSVLRLNRPAAALLGAVAMVTVGGLALPDAYHAIDPDVLVFLLGVMLLVGHLEVAGFFDWSAEWLIHRARTPRQLLIIVVMGSGLLSAFFVNDTVCLMLTPILVATTTSLGLRPIPYLIGLAMGANVGSLLTFAGNPQNMLIGLWSGIPFARFTLVMLPVVAGGLVLACGVLLLVYRRELAADFPRPIASPEVVIHPWLLGSSLVLFAGMVTGWLVGGSLPLVAISGGTLALAVAGRDPSEALEKVEWSLLLFFGALFVVMRGLEGSGAVAVLDQEGARFISAARPATSAAVVSGIMVVLSNLISNVPAVLLWRPFVASLPHRELTWQAIAMAATFGGNLLLIGSMANLIVAERAESRGVRVGYWEYARAGIPVTVLTVGWGILVLVGMS